MAKQKTQELDIWADQSNLPVSIEDVTAGKNLDVLLLDREKIDMILLHVEGVAKYEVYDPETKEGREQMIKNARAVSSSKTLFKAPFADRIREVKALPKIMTENNTWFNSEMDRIRDEVRKPADEWQAKQDQIAADKQAVIDQFANMENMLRVQLPVMTIVNRPERIQASIDLILSTDIRAADDRLEEAQAVKAECLQTLENFLAFAEKELAQAEKVEKDRVAAIQAQTKIDAQVEVAREIQQAKIDKEEAELMVKQTQENTDRQVALATNQAEEKAKREHDVEQARISKEQADVAESERLRSEDKEHRKAVNVEAMKALMALGIEKEMAQEVVKAAVLGKLGAMRIYY